MSEFGSTVKRIRMENDMTLDQVSEFSGLGKGTLSEIENGKSDPRLSSVLGIARALNLPAYILIKRATRDKR